MIQLAVSGLRRDCLTGLIMKHRNKMSVATALRDVTAAVHFGGSDVMFDGL